MCTTVPLVADSHAHSSVSPRLAEIVAPAAKKRG
jgi:hypothetical protein